MSSTRQLSGMTPCQTRPEVGDIVYSARFGLVQVVESPAQSVLSGRCPFPHAVRIAHLDGTHVAPELMGANYKHLAYTTSWAGLYYIDGVTQ